MRAMSLQPGSRRGLAVALVVHVVVTALVWRDIETRLPSELRGSKALWRLITAMNTGNSLLYLTLGRRRH